MWGEGSTVCLAHSRRSPRGAPALPSREPSPARMTTTLYWVPETLPGAMLAVDREADGFTLRSGLKGFQEKVPVAPGGCREESGSLRGLCWDRPCGVGDRRRPG